MIRTSCSRPRQIHAEEGREETITEDRAAENDTDRPLAWFHVATRLSDRAVVVFVRGELDMATAPILSDNVRCHDGRYDRLIYDLDGLGLSTSSVSALLECMHDEEQTSIRNPFVRCAVSFSS